MGDIVMFVVDIYYDMEEKEEIEEKEEGRVVLVCVVMVVVRDDNVDGF